jgi:hypothetical protein
MTESARRRAQRKKSELAGRNASSKKNTRQQSSKKNTQQLTRPHAMQNVQLEGLQLCLLALDHSGQTINLGKFLDSTIPEGLFNKSKVEKLPLN